jgi:sortase A
MFISYHVVSVVLGINSFTKALQPSGDNRAAVQVESTDGIGDESLVNDDRSADNAAQIGLNYVAAYWPNRVLMKNVQIDLPLTGSMENQGAWEVSETGANFAINTAIPNGQSGNTVIFGHDRPNLFRNIHNLKAGDQIIVYGADKPYAYAVDSFKIVKPTDVSVMSQTKSATLTLITCDGWLSQDRFVVTAHYVNDQAI